MLFDTLPLERTIEKNLIQGIIEPPEEVCYNASIMFTPRHPTFHNAPEESAPRSKKWLVIIVIILVVGGATAGFITLARSFTHGPTEIAHTNTTLTPDKKSGIFDSLKDFFFSAATPNLDGQAQNRINILMLGVGGPGHDGSYLSDTNIIMSLKPSTGEVAMISIPRDLMVKFEGYGYQKINAVSAYSELKHPGEGGELTRQFFSKQFNIDIPYYVRVDFQAFKEMIDTVGGVEVDVPVGFTDYRYPGPNYSYQTVSFTKGPVTLNGEQALIYSRSRHGNNGEGSDFARSRRQQQVLLALKQKLLSAGTLANPLVLKDIYDSLTAHVKTNLSFNQLIYLAGLSQHIDRNHIKNVVLDDARNRLITSLTNQLGDVLVPKSGTFTEINTLIAEVFSTSTTGTTPLDTPNLVASATIPDPDIRPTTSTRLNPSSFVIDVYNGTWEVGLAARVKKYLENKGYVIRTIGNSTVRPIDISGFYGVNPGVDRTLLTAMAKELGAHVGSSTPAWLLNSTTTPTSSSTLPTTPPDIIILIGKDYQLP